MGIDSGTGEVGVGEATARPRRLLPDTIRGRLALLLALPLVTVVVGLGANVAGQVHDYRSSAETTRAVGAALAVQSLVHELQRERGLTNGALGGEARSRADLGPQRERTNGARAALDGLTSGNAGLRGALDRFDTLEEHRGAVDAGRADRAGTFRWYTDAIASLNHLTLGLDQAPDQALRGHLAALRALGEAKEQAAQERGFLNGVFAAGRFAAGEYPQFTEIRAAKLAALGEFARAATADQRARAGTALRSPAGTQAAAFEEQALDGADGRPLRIDGRSWWTAMTTVVDDLRTTQEAVGEDVRQRAAALRTDATANALEFGLLALLAVAASVALAVFGARSVTRPLAALAREAEDVGTRRLPEAVSATQRTDEERPAAPARVHVPARATAEIRSVTRALDNLQRTAYQLATEQATLRRNTTESLANLGRRHQNLLRRQLGFISRLEQDEADPGALANLFELDHLATRMRRNAESLLVLVGETSPRRWAAPVPVADVVRAAVAEVEEYRRVVLRRLDDASVAGAAVSDLAHLLAELVENALSFSPPDIDVEIYGRRVGAQYLIAVVDQGVGMNRDDLARANARLRDPESFLSAPTRYLGHYVVGTLARLLHVDVEIAPSPVTGVTARVLVPAELVGDPTAAPVPEVLGVIDTVAVDAEPAPGTWFAVDAGPSPGPEPDREPEPARTRNGLVKRAPRSRAPQPTVVAPPERAPAPDRSPSEVGSMLTTFRAGHERGRRQATPTEPWKGTS
ncbi:nitrate- and nitrite sensing domain-containing protein [Longispora sp. K20-0274]|uniref:sensor histidine kinase n=1 Tax=Longispora sp. K20-0274 TaxID=3088255 RepID=UPI00399A0978